MRICCISDIHGSLPTIQPCDLLLIAGDICPHFSYDVGGRTDCFGQAKWLDTTFSKWLNTIPVKEKVITFGNHDWVAERYPNLMPKLFAHVLMNTSKTVMGLNIFGSPFSPWFHDWAFNSPRDNSEEFLSAIWNRIPHDTHIMITHGPPFGYGDVAPDGRPTGSQSLASRIKNVKPLLAVSGHIHCGYGVRQYERYADDFGYIVNASVVNERQELCNQPIYFDIEKNRISVVRE